MRKCRNCGVEIPENRRFCSRECYLIQLRKNARMRLQAKTCLTCGAEFQTKRPKAKFCSSRCFVIHKRLENRKRKEDDEPSESEPRFCLWCGIESKGKYCSLTCGQGFKTLTHRIHQTFPFDRATIDRELARLERLGCEYSFPSNHDDLNALYDLPQKRCPIRSEST